MFEFLNEKHLSIFLGFFLGSLLISYAVSNIFLVAGLVIGVAFLIKNKRISFNRTSILIVLYYIWGVCSLLWTTNVANTIHGIVKQLPLLIIPLFFAQYPKFNSENITKILRIFSLCVVSYFAVCIAHSFYQFNIHHKIDVFFYHSFVSLFDNNAIYVSCFTAFSLLGLINFVKKKNTWDFVLIFFLSVFLFLLSSKNLIISTIFIQIIISLKRSVHKKTHIICFLLIFIIFLFVFLLTNNELKNRFLFEINSNFTYVWNTTEFYDYVWTGSSLRFLQMKIAWEMFQYNHIGLLGLGLANAKHLLQEYYEHYNLYEEFYTYNFHNQYLQTLIELGFIGFLLLTSFIVYGFYWSIKRKNLCIFIVLTLISFLFFTESFFSRQKGILFFMVVFCIFSNVKESTLSCTDKTN